ncbi:MATE family efflux transporter, partial [Acinetobacter baumannii]
MAGTLWRLYRRDPALQPLSDPTLAAGGREGAIDILRLGVPIACIVLAEGGLFVLTSLLMARFGDEVVAAYQVAINFASLVFMIPLGVAMA